MPPEHRIKLIKYPSSTSADRGQGVGAHKDSSGWLTFLYRVGNQEGLEVLDEAGEWIAATPIENTFVVNFGNALEAATEGAVKATIHRVKVCAPHLVMKDSLTSPKAPSSSSEPRYSIPFFQGLPLDMTVSEVQSYIPENVRCLKSNETDQQSGNPVSSFLDPRWNSLGESQLRKWIRSHKDVGRKWYGDKVVEYYVD